MTEFPDPWPLWNLVLRTPRLELRPDDDAGLLELVEESYHGVHPPEFMPFGVPWTDAPRTKLGVNSMRHYWQSRSDLHAEKWSINFLVRLNGKVIGVQNVSADNFAITREVFTGSWIGMRHQGNGYGTEMRAAVLMLVFDHFGAEQARSASSIQNAQSLGVSRRLGYVEDGMERLVRRDQLTTDVRLLLTAERFIDFRPQWSLHVAGVDQARSLLEIKPSDTFSG